MDGAELASRIDHAFLKVDSHATVDALRDAVRLVIEHKLRALCVPPTLAATVKKNHPQVRVSAAVAFPLGTDSLAAKVFTLQELVEQQVDEVDVVLDLFALVNGNRHKIELEATRLGELTRAAGVMCKAIIETPILTEEQLRWAVEVLLESPIECIKTSTGYGREPTSLDHVRLIRDIVGDHKLIKAAGGITNRYEAEAMVAAGADIIGTSHSLRILEEMKTEAR